MTFKEEKLKELADLWDSDVMRYGTSYLINAEAFLERALDEQKARVLEAMKHHAEGDGSYCDTGEDMNWACRSECMDKAVERVESL